MRSSAKDAGLAAVLGERLGQAKRAARLLKKGSDDGTAVHDLRVAIRRLRTLLRAHGELTSEPPQRKLLKRLRRVMRLLGPAREGEVLRAWIDAQRKDLDTSLRQVLQDMLDKVAEQGGPRRRKTRGAFEKAVHLLEDYLAEVARDSSSPRGFEIASALCLRRAAGDLAQVTTTLNPRSSEEAIHAARIAGKELRYLLEPMADRIPSVPGLIGELRNLQDLFGTLHDLDEIDVWLTDALGKKRSRGQRRTTLIALRTRERGERAKLAASLAQASGQALDLGKKVALVCEELLSRERWDAVLH